MASYITQVSDGTNTVPVGSSLYGTCTTAAATAAKVVTMANFDTLINGVTIHVKFTNSNTATSPTLNVNSTGAKAIMRYGTTAPLTSADSSWNAGAVVSFTYDGTYWQMNDWVNSTYSLPIATASTLGGIKSGGSLNVNSDATTQVKFYDKGISANVDKLAMGCIDEFGHNKLAFLGAQYISVEYSTNAGSTWTDYGATDAQKIASVTTSGSGFYVGKKTTGVTVNDQVRITLQAAQSGNNRIYTAADQLLINISTSGAGGCKAKIETLTIGNVINNVNSWTTLGTYDVSGWTGWNSIPCGITFGGGDTQTSQIGKLRITLSLSTLSSTYNNALQLIDVRLIGHTNWTMPSELARAGHLYTMDTAQNATFPAKVAATGGFSGNLTGNVTGNATNATTATKLSTSSAGSASQPVYFANGIPVAGNSIPLASSSTPSDVAATAAVGTGTTWARADHRHKLPIASASLLGGIKVGNNLSIDSNGVLSATGGTGDAEVITFIHNNGTVTCDKTPTQVFNSLSFNKYLLVLIKEYDSDYFEYLDNLVCVGNTVTFSALTTNLLNDGFILQSNLSSDYKRRSVVGNRTNNTWTYSISPILSLPIASTTMLGGVRVGSGLSVDSGGTISATGYSLPTASASTLGGIKVGSNLSINSSGVLSANAAPVSSVNGQTGEVTTASSFTITLSASGWSSNTQTITNSNFVTSGYIYNVAPSSSSYLAYGESQIYADDITVANKITFHCQTVPSVNLTVNIGRIKVV